ncbi:hypothetical protein CEK62_18775 [Alcanivorax sp. N3-2A]|nr:hypothetical protein CEK62_18775 [Alcanivorax sp. N3-2A]|tara:strand:- start:28368 stop:28691 length:324 start_codon:yes stop_codon:yes gene_type:complete
MKHVNWDAPGDASVRDHYAKDPNDYADPHAGSVLSARHQGQVVRVTVDAYKDGTSYGKVAAIIDPETGKRLDSHGDLKVGDSVTLDDGQRAFEPDIKQPDEDDDWKN